MIKSRRKWNFIFIALFLLAVTFGIIDPFIGLSAVSSYLYVLLTVLWMYSLRHELKDRYIKRSLYTGGALVILLFILRFIRYDLVASGSIADRLLWYGYYISFTALPMLSLTVAVYVGRNKKRHPFIRVLWFICLGFIALVMTNDLHGLVLRIWYENGKAYSETQPLLYVLVGWSIVLLSVALGIVLHKCRLMEVRKYWWLPVVVGLTGLLLWIGYYVNGGSSPKLFGISLYNVQEVYLFIFLGYWESSIAVGLIPTASLAREREWIREGVLGSVKEELDEIKQIFDSMWQADEAAFTAGLQRISCLGVYIKRRANLELITDARGYLNTKELSLAIRETFDYRNLDGMSVGFEETGNLEVPALTVTGAYELTETVLEEIAGSACFIKLAAGEDADGRSVKLLIEAAPGGEDEEYAGRLKEAAEEIFAGMSGVSIAVRNEDDTILADIKVSLPEGGGRKLKRVPRNKTAPGLKGIADYLALEDEALRVKTRLHDRMGRCLVLNRRYLSTADATLKASVLTEWSRAIAWMEGEADGTGTEAGRSFAHCIRQAEALGLKLVTEGEPRQPLGGEVSEIIDTAITTHITNVLRHTDADTVFISFDEENGKLKLELSDSGSGPVGPVAETGGLANLKNITEAAGGSMRLETEPAFKLTLVL